MYWSNKRPTYDILTPKLDKSIFKLDEQEAAAYFEWFVDMIPERVSYVFQDVRKGTWSIRRPNGLLTEILAVALEMVSPKSKDRKSHI